MSSDPTIRWTKEEAAARWRERCEKIKAEFVAEHGQELWDQLIPNELRDGSRPQVKHETSLDLPHFVAEEGRRIKTVLQALGLPLTIEKAKESIKQLRSPREGD